MFFIVAMLPDIGHMCCTFVTPIIRFRHASEETFAFHSIVLVGLQPTTECEEAVKEVSVGVLV